MHSRTDARRFARRHCSPRVMRVAAVAALLLLPPVAALDVVRVDQPSPTTNAVFANGLDAYGRDAACRACHAVIRALNENLIEKLVAVRSLPRTPSNYGAADAAIEAAIAPACRLSATWRDADVRRACEGMMERGEEAVAATYHRWLERGGGVDRGLGRGSERRLGGRDAWRRYDPEGWNWNYELCGRATRTCREELALHELEEFDEEVEGEGDAKRYRSEQRPSNGETVDGMLKVTAGTFHEEVVRRETDVIAYVGFPKRDKWAHFYMASVLGSVREMFHGNETARGTLEIAFVDGTHNDVPPPYGSDAQTPTVAMFGAGNKNWPRYMTDMNDGKLTAFEVLNFIMRTSTSLTTVRHANWLVESHPASALHRKIWEADDDEL